VPAPIKDQIANAQADILSGKRVVWKGPITKQDGSAAAPAGQAMALEDVETMGYLVKGVIGGLK